MSARGLLLAVDTATHTSVVTLGGAALDGGSPLATSTRSTHHRHGSGLLEQIDEVLAAAGTEVAAVGALAVGTGPGSFTGLRVGLATIKTLAYVRGLALVGVATAAALRRAAAAAGADAAATVVLPAGARDHYLARPDEAAVLVPPDRLVDAVGADPVVTVDLPAEVLGAGPARLGVAAVGGLPAALLALARERLARAEVDDVAALTPAYVALPRGVQRGEEELAWSPVLR